MNIGESEPMTAVKDFVVRKGLQVTESIKLGNKIITKLLDSSDVSTISAASGGTDSASVIALIDSDYVQARQTSGGGGGGGSSVTLLADDSALTAMTGMDSGDMGFVTGTKAFYVFDGTNWVNPNDPSFAYLLRAGDFTGPLTGTESFSPNRTVTLQTITASIESSVSSNVVFTIKKTGSSLQQFTIPAGDTLITANFTTNSVSSSDTITLDVDSGSGRNLTVKIKYV